MSFAPPKIITKLSRCSWLISLRAKCVIYSSLKPGITALITSKYLANEVESSSAQPLAWPSPLIKILFLYGFNVHFYFSQLLFSQPNLGIQMFLILLGNYLVARNNSWLSVLIAVVVHLAVCCISVWYSRLFFSFLKYFSQDHCLEHSNHRGYLVCL